MHESSETSQVDLINVDLLPPNLRLLCRVLGSRRAFELCQVRGGVPLQVPVRASLEHWLAEVIGMDGLQALVDALAGEQLDVPKYDKVAMQLRHQQVQACLMAGMGPTRTALKLGYTKRHVLNLQTDLLHDLGMRYAPPEHGSQQDMFAELLVPCSPDDDAHDFDRMEEAAVAEQEANAHTVTEVDEEHREVALASNHGAHNPFGITSPKR